MKASGRSTDRGGLSRGAGALVRISAAIGAGDRDALEQGLRDALSLTREAHMLSVLAVEETLLQSHLFAGYPATLRAFTAWRRAGGPSSGRAVAANPVIWEERGAAVCAAVYGGQYEKLRARVAALHPELDRWMVRDGYGRVLGRPGLALVTRELCIVALLCAQDSEPQLYAHMRGALQVGAAAEVVEATIREACAVAPAERRPAAWRVWSRVRASRTGAGGGTETKGAQ